MRHCPHPHKNSFFYGRRKPFFIEGEDIRAACDRTVQTMSPATVSLRCFSRSGSRWMLSLSPRRMSQGLIELARGARRGTSRVRRAYSLPADSKDSIRGCAFASHGEFAHCTLPPHSTSRARAQGKRQVVIVNKP